MDCRDYRAQFIDLFDDELDFRQTEKLLRHVANCSACSADLKSMYVMISGIRKLDKKASYFPEYEDKIKLIKSRCKREKAVRVIQIVLSTFAFLILALFILMGFTV